MLLRSGVTQNNLMKDGWQKTILFNNCDLMLLDIDQDDSFIMYKYHLMSYNFKRIWPSSREGAT